MIKLVKDFNQEEITAFYSSALWKCIATDFYFHPQNIEYSLEYFGRDLLNLSTVVYQNNIPVLAFFAYSENKELRYFHWPVQIYELPGADVNALNDAYRELFVCINEWQKKDLVNKLFFYKNAYFTSEYFEKLISVQPQQHAVINLGLSQENIRMNIRRRYKTFINWGEKNLETTILDAYRPDADLFYAYKKFHFEVSGRQTRNDRTWEIQFEMLKNNLTFLVLCHLKDKLVSGCMIPHGTETAFYGVGVNDRKLMAENMPIGHYPIYASIMHAKKIGMKRFHLNKIDFTKEDPKLNNIARFKAGFTSTLETVIACEADLISKEI